MKMKTEMKIVRKMIVTDSQDQVTGLQQLQVGQAPLHFQLLSEMLVQTLKLLSTFGWVQSNQLKMFQACWSQSVTKFYSDHQLNSKF